MIRIIENSANKLTIKQYPANSWLVCIFAALLSSFLGYYTFFQSPISSYLVCTKDFFNQTNCELIESALLNHDLNDRQIENIKDPHKTISSRSNVILLTTGINIWRRKIQNIYYPSSLFLDPFLYRTNKQVSTEINKLNDFIKRPRDSQTLTIKREIPKPFLIIVWIQIIPVSLPIVFIFTFSIQTYCFNLRDRNFIVAETIFFATEEQEYSLKDLKVISKIDNTEPSIVLTINNKQEYILKDLVGEKELPKILKLIEPFTTMPYKDN